jgi:tellurite resistance protein
MAALILTDDLARALVGALLAVGRADGALEPAEIGVLRSSARALAPGLEVDDEWLLGTEISPLDLAAAVAAGAGAFRSAGTSTRQEIAAVFIELALEVARADGSPTELELAVVRSFVEHLGGPLDRLDGLLAGGDGVE